tara:strand:+ start:979 stop:1200 length:222 start_codon:yes stop_codon:yes gene_type:complete
MARVLKSWDEAKPGATANINAMRQAASGERTSKVENENQVEETTEAVEEEAVEETTDDAEETTEEEATEDESE